MTATGNRRHDPAPPVDTAMAAIKARLHLGRAVEGREIDEERNLKIYAVDPAGATGPSARKIPIGRQRLPRVSALAPLKFFCDHPMFLP